MPIIVNSFEINEDQNEGAGENKQNILCKYFLHGACSKGIECPFGHDLACRTDKVCKFYLAGSCSYGKSCRYDHVKPPRNVLKPIPTSYHLEHQVKRVNMTILTSRKTSSWAEATEFVPGRKGHGINSQPEAISKCREDDVLYSNIASASISSLKEHEDENVNEKSFEAGLQLVLCPFVAVRECPFGEKCEYLHGLACEICGLECLHPTDIKQQEEHKKECTEYHEKKMDRVFAAKRSDGVSCSICLDVVLEKVNVSERVFGILENCTHPFCLSCIRKWRKSYEQGKNLIRSCPICRINSWFVTPSEFWVENKEDKKKVINEYKGHLSKKPCRSFDFGKGGCQFGNSCFYKHEYSDGTKETSKPDLRYREGADGDVSVTKTHRLDEFIAERDL